MTTKMTAEEMVSSLTGFDEIAIEKHMGIDPYADGERKPVKVLRSLVFVLKLREGMNAAAAAKAANELTVGEVNALFAEEPVAEDGTEEQPVTATGNDSAPAA